jgi:endonuclease/exonuclease/phosphatase family metal-dependent hydrolase
MKRTFFDLVSSKRGQAAKSCLSPFVRYRIWVVAALACFSYALFEPQFIRHQEPEFLTFEELRVLSRNAHPGGAIEKKLDRFWRTPIINNEAYYRGTRPHDPQDPRLGKYLRLASWNIEKSYMTGAAVDLMTSREKFERMIDPAKVSANSVEYQEMLNQREKFSNADILVLQEMDMGVKRSHYVDAAREIAQALDMNYAYGTEQLEVDPVFLGLEKIFYEDSSLDEEATDYYTVDPTRYKGAFGCAVLSRYPIKFVQVFQLQNQPYDWHTSETPKIGFMEQLRRQGSKTVFKNEMTREIKVGGRMFFRVDLHVPELPGQTLSIINIHLEIKCQPKGREAQMEEILNYIRTIKHPVIVVGDFNSAPQDLSPTSTWRVVSRTAKNPETWVSVGTSAVLPQALVVNTTRITSKLTKNLQDPTARNIPLLSPNPVKPLFNMIEDFRFDDGSAFDFRGDGSRSINGNDGTLANSNQRDFKGFKTTFSVKRPIAEVLGKYRLDWVFVKSNYLKDPKDYGSSYRFAPHFAETLEEMNTGLFVPISDHHPNVVDIPFEEPRL